MRQSSRPREARSRFPPTNTEAHQIVIEVADTGIGIDAKVMPRIFDAFEQGGGVITSKYGGLGLGLAISKRVVDLHHGTIAVRSDGPGRGATFTVTLNAMETSLLEGPVLFLESEPPSMKHIQLLFVEDHEDTARVLGRILRNAGFDVSQAGTVAEARTLAAGRRFDLVISDLGLPDGSGLELMQQLARYTGIDRNCAERIWDGRRCGCEPGRWFRETSHEAGGLGPPARRARASDPGARSNSVQACIGGSSAPSLDRDAPARRITNSPALSPSRGGALDPPYLPTSIRLNVAPASACISTFTT